MIVLHDHRTCEKALREPDSKQALYDECAIPMHRVLVTLHGEEHRARRCYAAICRFNRSTQHKH